MLRAAHYKPEAVDLPTASKSPPKHRPGGILDLALTAADKYALSLLPAALKGTALAGSDGIPAPDYRAAHHHPTNGIPPPFKVQRGAGNPLLQTMPVQLQGVVAQQVPGDPRIATSWDASLKEILAALEPDNRTLKPAKLRDHKYPSQNHGIPPTTSSTMARRELDEALVTLPGGTRRGKGTVPAYAVSALKAVSRQSRRPELQGVDVHYDLVPSVKLAWANPGTGTYSTAGFGGSPKKYTSQLVGRVSPHYSGTAAQQVQPSALSGNQDALHLPDITTSNGYAPPGVHTPVHAHHASLRGQSSFQSWPHTPGFMTPSNQTTHPRRALPYVSAHAPSLAKPLTVQYHPVLRSPSGANSMVQTASPGASAALAAESSMQTPRPAPDQGGEAYPSAAASPRDAQGPGYIVLVNTPQRLPQTPPEVAAEVARLRHAQELDGVIRGIRSDLLQATPYRVEPPPKSKFLQMYEDPNRPLAKLNPKQLLGDMMPQARRKDGQHPAGASAQKQQGPAAGPSPLPSAASTTGANRSPMYDRRLKPLPGSAQLDSSGQQLDAEEYAEATDTADAGQQAEQPPLLNVHLRVPDSMDGAMEQVADAPTSLPQRPEETIGGSSGRSTPLSSLLAHEDMGPMEPELGPASGSGAEPVAAAEAAGAEQGAQQLVAESAAQGTVPSDMAQEDAVPVPIALLPETFSSTAANEESTQDVENTRDSAHQEEREQQAEQAGTEQAAALSCTLQQTDQQDAQAQAPGEAQTQIEEIQQVVADAAVQEAQPDAMEAVPESAERAVEAETSQASATEAMGPVEVEAGTADQQAEVVGGLEAVIGDPAAVAQQDMEAAQQDMEAAQQDMEAAQQDMEASATVDTSEPISKVLEAEPPTLETLEATAPMEEGAGATQGPAVEETSIEPSSTGVLDAEAATAEAEAGPELQQNADEVSAVSEQPVAPVEEAEAAQPSLETEPEQLQVAEPPAPPAGADGSGEAQPMATTESETLSSDVLPADAAGSSAVEFAAPASNEGVADGEGSTPADGVAALVPDGGDVAIAEPVPAVMADTDVVDAVATAGYALPPGLTPEMAETAVIRIQSHARGYLARQQVGELRKARDAAQAATEPAASSTPTEDADPYSLPPGVTPEMARTAIVRIQSHARGLLARRQVAELRKGREAGQAALAAAVSAVTTSPSAPFDLPPGVTPEMVEAAAVRIQSHARGYLARQRVAALRKGREADAQAPADDAATMASTDKYELPPGVTKEMAEAAAVHVQSHMRGHLARRRVKQLRADRAPLALAGDSGEPGPQAEAEASLLETVEAESTEVLQELTIDALKAALEDEEDDVAAAAPEMAVEPVPEPEPEPEATPEIDMSDPAVVAAAAVAAAAAAKAAAKELGDADGADGVADTTATVDQSAAEASMARLAATSARTSAMFQGAGAEMRYSDDEASAMELMDNLDGLLQGDDEAAAAAAAVAAATAPADGELVSISADGVSEPQSLGTSSGAAAVNPMDVQEPGGVRVLASKYEVQHVVGEGAYGMVMKCKVRGTDPVQWVAIKEFKIDDNDPDAEDVKRTSLREVAVLEALSHPHVVSFVDKFMVGDRLFIVMEFLPCNLLELLEAQPGGMDRDAVRLIMFQLCSAIAFIHTKGMVYRDIKPENLLVDEHGTVKLCDFGFARYLPSGPASHLTDYVATRWYRAPELLLGPPYRDSTGKHVQYMYGPQVDMWAVGCLMGELLDGEPLFAGDSDLDQLYRVQQILGPMAPSHQYLFYANPHNTGIVFNIKQPLSLSARYRGKVSDVELDFISGLLEMDPEKRLTGEQCLQHPYLADLAAAAQTLPTPSESASPTPTATTVDYADPVSSAPQATPASPLPGERDGTWRGSGTPSSRGLMVAESLTRAAGSLTGRLGSLGRGLVSPSPPPQSQNGTPLRASSVVRAHESGEVVIMEGVVEMDDDPAQGLEAVKSISALAEMAATEDGEITPL